MSDLSTGASSAQKPQHINVTVSYAAAKKPFSDSQASDNETVGHLKGRVLKFFELQDSPPGSGKSYSLALGENLLTDPSATLGSLTDHGRHLKLTLVEQFTQG